LTAHVADAAQEGTLVLAITQRAGEPRRRTFSYRKANIREEGAAWHLATFTALLYITAMEKP
jgi:hypothetical protein